MSGAEKEVVVMTVPSTRRAFLGFAAGTIGALVTSRMPAVAAPARPASAAHSLGQETLAGPFTLPLLDYATYALEPHIDQLTMEILLGVR